MNFDIADIMVRETNPLDIAPVVGRMRRKDEDEVIASGFSSAEEALSYSFGVSQQCYTIERNGLPLAMFGLVRSPDQDGVGIVWFLGTDEMKTIKKSFVKQSRVVIAKFLEVYPVLTNWVDAKYTEAISWLESCGAEFDPPVAVGRNGAMFTRFEIRRTS